jgi:4-amino-4-deoxy-L-arabinose transferase-like glycosyltransferase
MPPAAVAMIVWTAIAAGLLIKGPMILMFAGFAAVALVAADRSARWVRRLKPAIGVPFALALVMPWLVAILIRSGGGFLTDALGEDMFAKVTAAQETHGMPPGFYFVVFWETFFPGAMLAGLAAPAVWRARAEPGCKVLLAWVVPAWIALELVPTKLPHYVLPLYPALAILIAGVVGPRYNLVVHPDDGGRAAFDRVANRRRPAAWPVDMVLRGSGGDLLAVRLAAL